MTQNNKKYLNALNIIFYQNSGAFRKILDYFKEPELAYKQSDQQILHEIDLKDNLIEKFLEYRNKIDIEKEFERLTNLNINILGFEDYPNLLKEIYDPPLILYAQGNIDLIYKKSLAIVGSRNISSYGKEICKNFIKEFAKHDLSLVSGYAYGVDYEVHRNALENNVSTIAVLAGGLNKKYPAYSKNFADEMTREALFLSEYPLNTESLHYHFPIRNRIISGLSQAVLLIEAQEKSGSLITAKSALEQNREVLAVPGSIFNSQSMGTNMLIQKGEAGLVLTVADVLKALKVEQLDKGLDSGQARMTLGFDIEFSSEDEKKVYEILKNNGEMFFDEILEKIEIDGIELSSLLGMMEVRGMISNNAGRFKLI